MRRQLSNEISEKLDEILREAIEFDSADMGMIQLFDREEETLSVIAQKGLDAHFLGLLKVVKPFDPTPCGRAIAIGKPVVIPDVEQDIALEHALKGVARAAGFLAVKSVPLLAGNEKKGVLSTYFKTPQCLLEKKQGIPTEHINRVTLLLQTVSAHIKEAELIALLTQRDKKGMEILYDRYADILYCKIGLVIADNAIAEKVLKRTFLAAWENFHLFNPRAEGFYQWLEKMALCEANKFKPIRMNSIALKTEPLTSAESRMIELLYLGGCTQQDIIKNLAIPSVDFPAQLRIAINKLRKDAAVRRQ